MYLNLTIIVLKRFGLYYISEEMANRIINDDYSYNFEGEMYKPENITYFHKNDTFEIIKEIPIIKVHTNSRSKGYLQLLYCEKYNMYSLMNIDVYIRGENYVKVSQKDMRIKNIDYFLK